MQITFSLLTLIALMPLSLHAWNSFGTRPILDTELFSKIPHGSNPFSKAETKNKILNRFKRLYQNDKLHENFRLFYNVVENQWGIWLKDFYAATSTNTWTVTGAGLNAWRAQAEEHFLGMVRTVISEDIAAYDVLLVQEMLVGFKEFVLIPMLLVRRLNKRGLFSDANTLLKNGFCWTSKTYFKDTYLWVTVLDNCGPNKRCVGVDSTQAQDYRIPIVGPVSPVKIGGRCLPCPANNPTCKPSANYRTVVPNRSKYSQVWNQPTESHIYATS
jgi:hypothetical protein